MSALNIQASSKLIVLPVAFGLLIWLTFANSSFGQAVVETAGTTSVSGSVAASGASVAKAVGAVKFPSAVAPGTAAGGTGSAHLIASSGPPPEETNRGAFEAQAGKDAGKVLLRAAPVQALIWVNGKIVGKTPLLLVLAPGKYQIEMRGTRGETGKGSVDLLPHETRELAIKLNQLYPGRITASH
jgi:hypothetical protein